MAGQGSIDPAVDVVLHSKPLRVGIIADGYYVINPATHGTQGFTGYGIDIINIVTESLNFRYDLVLPADGEWGVEHDGQWTGLVGLLQRKEIDMAFMLSPSVERGQVVQWTVPVEYWYNNIAVRTHNVQPDLWTAFFSPFHWSVYTCMLLLFVMCTCLLLHVMRRESTVLSGREKAWSPAEVGLFLFGSMLGRGLSWSWNGNSARTIIAGWCIVVLILASSYTGKVTSLLVGVTPTPPFTSVREMLTRAYYRWGMVGGTKSVQILRDSNNSEHQELYRRMLAFAEADPDVLSRDYTVHLTKVLTQSYAYIGDSPVLEIWVAEHCDMTMLPVKLTGMEYYSILLPKDSVITDVVNKKLLRLHDSGSLTFTRSRWFPSATRCHGNRSPDNTFSLATLQGPFYVAAAGLLLAAGVLCVERCRKTTSNC